MRIRYVILIVVVTAVLSFLTAQFVPISKLAPKIEDNTITLNDYYSRLINGIGIIVTLCAVLVALFKEDIRRLYRYASLNIDFRDETHICEVTESEKTTSTSGNISAKKYELVVVVINSGKLAARNCQFYLDQIRFKRNNHPSPKDYNITGEPLNWVGKKDSSIMIPSTAKGQIKIAEIHSPEAELKPEKDAITEGAKIKIFGSNIHLDNYNGTYICNFTLYSENASPVSLNVEIIWDGKWHQRITEMKDCVAISKK